MIDFFSDKLKTPYPWPKYSQVIVNDFVVGAMENTSATIHDFYTVYQTKEDIIDGRNGETAIAHELFHQWFGDLATPENWSNLALKESFATYAEYLWLEHKYGRDAADAHHFMSKLKYLDEPEKNKVKIIRDGSVKNEEMFDVVSYDKGAQVLHMLRKYLGDDLFFNSLKAYLEKYQFKNANINDLLFVFEEVSGKELDWFFNEWWLAVVIPVLEISRE